MNKQTNNKPCPACGGDMGTYTDLCNNCWEIEHRVRMLKYSHFGEERTLKYFGLQKIKEK